MYPAYPSPTCMPNQSDLQRLIGYLLPTQVYDWLPIYQYSCKPYRSDTYGLQVIQHLSKTQLTRITAGSQHSLHLHNVGDGRFKGESKRSNTEKTRTTEENGLAFRTK